MKDDLRTFVNREAFNQTGRELLDQLASVCRDHGAPVNDRYGPKYRLLTNGLEVYVDDYGCYATAKFNGTLVMSNHPCDRFMVRGEWEPVAEQVLGMVPSFAGAGI